MYWFSFLCFLDSFSRWPSPSLPLPIFLYWHISTTNLIHWTSVLHPHTTATAWLSPHPYLTASLCFCDLAFRIWVTFSATAACYKSLVQGELRTSEPMRQADGHAVIQQVYVGFLPLISLDFKFLCPPQLAGASTSVIFLHFVSWHQN